LESQYFELFYRKANILLFQRQQVALDGADRGGGDVAVLGGEGLRVLAHVLDHRAQVLEVEQQHAVVVGDLEHQREHAGLGVVEVEQARDQERAHVGDGGAHRVALLAEHVPEHHRVGTRGVVVDADCGQALHQLVGPDARGADAGEVALDVGDEHRHADMGEGFGELLQGHRLAGAGGAGDEAVAVGQARQQADVLERSLSCARAISIGSAISCSSGIGSECVEFSSPASRLVRRLRARVRPSPPRRHRSRRPPSYMRSGPRRLLQERRKARMPRRRPARARSIDRPIRGWRRSYRRGRRFLHGPREARRTRRAGAIMRASSIARAAQRFQYGGSLEMGQHPAPQGSSGRKARCGVLQAGEGDHRRRQDGRG
jgi:hypothetical protein